MKESVVCTYEFESAAGAHLHVERVQVYRLFADRRRRTDRLSLRLPVVDEPFVELTPLQVDFVRVDRRIAS